MIGVELRTRRFSSNLEDTFAYGSISKDIASSGFVDIISSITVLIYLFFLQSMVGEGRGGEGEGEGRGGEGTVHTFHKPEPL